MSDLRATFVRRPASVSAVLASFLLTSVSGAEPATTAATGDQPTNAPILLPAVVVTAQKEPADLQSLPVSVTAITPATLQEADVR
ncbi:MAG TPA: hypothetical protein VEC99_06015, partial [Clostridia bacterium]|nr:hypothetical protein [Clostridia bacterium]